MPDRDIRVRLLAEIGNYQQGLKTAARSTEEFGRSLAGQGKATHAQMERIGRSSLLMAAGLTAGIGLSIKAAVDWESAWAGVTKTVNGSEQQMAGLEAGLRNLAGELPATHAEIAGVAEAAGQLGISVGGIERFTETMINLGETTNLTAEEAATSLARISNIMGTSERDVERMGSTIVELGNNSATTEAEIVAMSTRIAAAGKIAGLSEADVFAFASTLTSVGVNAEMGGTALSKTFRAIRDAVIVGGEELDIFAEIAGVTIDEFRSAFQDDAGTAIAMFLEGLDRVNKSGGSTTELFKDIGLDGERMGQALESTAAAGDLLANSLAMAGKAWEENTALQTEAEQRYNTTAAQLEILRNKVTDLAIDAGSTLLPALNGVVDVLGSMADGIATLPGPVKDVALGLSGVSAAGLGVIGMVGIMAPKISEAKTALQAMGGGGKFLGNNLGKLSAGLAAVGIAVAAGATIYSLATAAGREYAEGVKEVEAALSGVVDGQVTLNEAMQELFDTNFDELGAKNIATINALELSLSDFEDSVKSGGDALDPLRSKLSDMGIEFDATTGKVSSFGEGTADALRAAGLSADDVNTLNNAIEDLDNEIQEGTRNILERAAADKDLSRSQLDAAIAANTAADGTVNYVGAMSDLVESGAIAEGAVEDLSTAIAEQEEETISATEALENYVNSLNALFDPLFGAQDAMLSLAEAQAAVTELEKDGKTGTEEYAAAQRDAVRAALDLESSLAELAGGMHDGSVDTDRARQMLDQWVASGRITEEQAAQVAGEIDNMVAEANAIPANKNLHITLTGLEAALVALDRLDDPRTATVSVYALAGPRTQALLRGNYPSSGGLIPSPPSYLAAGGMAFMPPRGSDVVPAMLTPGEFVTNAKATADNLPLLRAINSGVKMTAASGAAPGQPSVTIVMPMPPGDELGRAMQTWFRKTARTEGGGSVQVAFGT